MTTASEDLPRIRIGTSGWSYDHWIDVLYPPDLPQNERLARYAQEFDTVEINSSFYRLPWLNMIKAWNKRSPEGFVFAAKCQRRLTHVMRLKDTGEDLRRFLNRVGLLGAKLGPVLYQLPPSFARDDGVLEAFLADLPPGQHVVEFRHASWESPDVYSLLSHYGVSHCVVSMPNYPVDLTTTGSFAYVRLHGAAQLYASLYGDEELRDWAQRLTDLADSGVGSHVYFNNDAQGFAVENARRLRELVG